LKIVGPNRLDVIVLLRCGLGLKGGFVLLLRREDALLARRLFRGMIYHGTRARHATDIDLPESTFRPSPPAARNVFDDISLVPPEDRPVIAAKGATVTNPFLS
jgi:hypothetical protein